MSTPTVSNMTDRSVIAKNMDNIKYIYDSHIKSGLLHRQAVALLGNYVVESGVDPRKHEKNGKGYGLIQATDPSRKANVKKYQSQIVFDGADHELKRQANYVEDNILSLNQGEWRHGGERGFDKALEARNAFRDETDITELTRIAMSNYFRPNKEKAHANRRIDASIYLDKYLKDNNIEQSKNDKSFIRPSSIINQYLTNVDQYAYGGYPQLEALDLGQAGIQGATGALSGAAAGAAGGPIGMAVGAGIGLISGFITGIFQADSQRKERYEKAKQQFDKQIKIEDDRAEKIKEELNVTDKQSEGKGYYAALGLKRLPTNAFRINV